MFLLNSLIILVTCVFLVSWEDWICCLCILNNLSQKCKTLNPNVLNSLDSQGIIWGWEVSFIQPQNFGFVIAQYIKTECDLLCFHVRLHLEKDHCDPNHKSLNPGKEEFLVFYHKPKSRSGRTINLRWRQQKIIPIILKRSAWQVSWQLFLSEENRKPSKQNNFIFLNKSLFYCKTASRRTVLSK